MVGTGRHGGQLVGTGPSARRSRSDAQSSNEEPLDRLLNKAGIPVDQIRPYQNRCRGIRRRRNVFGRRSHSSVRTHAILGEPVL